MRNAFLIVGAVILAAVCADCLRTALVLFVLPSGQSFTVTSPRESLDFILVFAFWLGACAALAAATLCYLRSYRPIMRGLIVLSPMLVAALIAAFFKADYYHGSLAVVELTGLKPMLSLKQAALHLVPAIAFFSGSAAVTIAWLRRKKMKAP